MSQYVPAAGAPVAWERFAGCRNRPTRSLTCRFSEFACQTKAQPFARGRLSTNPGSPPNSNSRPGLRILSHAASVLLVVLAGPLRPRQIFAATPKVHTVTLGPFRKVPYTQPDATPDTRADETSSLKIRSLFVDDRQKEWTMGDVHDVTDRTFTVRRALRINDSLPGDTAQHWMWQPGPWISVDRVTGHITALHLPDFDAAVSDATWFRDYAAYCGTSTTGKGGLFAIVAQLGAHRAVVQKQIGTWPQTDHFLPVCQPAQWQRLPMRVTIKPTGGEATTYDVVGSASLIEEGDSPEEDRP